MFHHLFFLASSGFLSTLMLLPLPVKQSLPPPDEWLANIEANLMLVAQDFSYYALIGSGSVLLIKAFTGK